MRKNCVQRVVGGVVCSGVTLGALLVGGVPAIAEQQSGSVTGRIWFDRDADGQQDDGEPGYQWSKTVSVTKGGEFIGYFDTNAEGRFSVTGLTAGTYRVANVQSGLFAETTAPYQDITLTEGGTAEVNIGVKGGSLSGTAWVDTNANGQLDEGDERLAGETVKMVGPAGLTGEMTTSDTGEYRFQDLPNGTNYQIVAPAPEPGLIFSPWGVIDPSTNASRRMQIWRGTDRTVDIVYVEPVDFAVGTPTVDPERASYAVGDEVTVKVPVTNKSDVADKFQLTASYSAGIEVLEVTGTSGLTLEDVSDEVLEPGDTATVTVRLRAVGASESVLFQVHGVTRQDTNPENDNGTVPLVVTATSAPTTQAPVQQVNNPAPQKKAAHPANLASTGASPVVPLTIGAGLLIAGAGTLLLLRRRTSGR